MKVTISYAILFTVVVIILLSTTKAYTFEIIDTYNDIKTTFEGLSRFLDNIYSFIAAISGFLGYRAIALFFAIAFTSAGLSAIGFPKGKVSFFVSLIIVNFLWFTWNRSFDVEIFNALFTIIKTNAIILFPYILFLLIKRYKFTIANIYKQSILHIFPFLREKGYTQNELLNFMAELNKSYNNVILSLLNDFNQKENHIQISSSTTKAIKELLHTLHTIKVNGGKQ